MNQAEPSTGSNHTATQTTFSTLSHSGPIQHTTMSDWVVAHGLATLAEAEATLQTAIELEPIEPEAAEQSARSALAEFRSAMNWLEDSDHFDNAHQRIDEAGAYVRRTFGCQLHQEGMSYEQRCPVALAHNRIGFSVGMFIEQSECSICGADPATCQHITGRTYDGEFCARKITKGRVTEVSLVGRPAQPDARIHQVTVDHAVLRDHLGPRWQPGVPVNCDKCLRPCTGISDPYETPAR